MLGSGRKRGIFAAPSLVEPRKRDPKAAVPPADPDHRPKALSLLRGGARRNLCVSGAQVTPILHGVASLASAVSRKAGRTRRPGGRDRSVIRNPSSRSKDLTAAQNVVRSVNAEERIAWVPKSCADLPDRELFVRGRAQGRGDLPSSVGNANCAADALDNKVSSVFGVA